MTRKMMMITVVLAVLGMPLMAIAQSEPVQAQTQAQVLTDGEVTKVDQEASKITIKHGPIKKFEMDDGMTMVFAVTDPAMLKTVKAGDKIAINPSRPCGACPRCREGRENLCDNMRFLGSASIFPHVQGMFREYFLMGERQLTPVAGEHDRGPAGEGGAQPLAELPVDGLGLRRVEPLAIRRVAYDQPFCPAFRRGSVGIQGIQPAQAQDVAGVDAVGVAHPGLDLGDRERALRGRVGRRTRRRRRAGVEDRGGTRPGQAGFREQARQGEHQFRAHPGSGEGAAFPCCSSPRLPYRWG